MATARRLIVFGNFSRHPLLIWLHCYLHHYKTLKAVATATAAIVVLTPANFYHFWRPKFNFQTLFFTLRPLAKNLQKQKLLLGSMWRKSKKKIEKRLLNRLRWSRNEFLPKLVDNDKSRRFLDTIFLLSCLNRFRSTFQKNTIFMSLCDDILRSNFFDLKNSINRQINYHLKPLKGFGIFFFWVISPSNIFKHILEND